MKWCVFLFVVMMSATISTAQVIYARDVPAREQLKQELLATIYTDPEEQTRCGPGIQSTYRQTSRDQTFNLFRLDDIDRLKQIGTLEIIDGHGFVYPLKKMKLDEAESLFGKSRDRLIVTSTDNTTNRNRLTHRAFSTSPKTNHRIFDLLAVGSDNQPKIFHLTILFAQGLYTVDGPGIGIIKFKRIGKKEELEI